MKTYHNLQIFVSFLCFFLFFQLNGQYSRSFHTTDYAGEIRTNKVFEYNDTIYSLSTKECNDSTFKLQIIQLDNFGETIKYHTINGNSLYGNHMISGISISADTMIVALQSKITTVNKLVFLKIELNSFSLISTFINPMNFKFGYSECIQKNDSLVIYLSNLTSGIYRFSHAIANPAVYSQELVSSVINITGSSLGHKAFELILSGQDEFFVSKSTLYHRNSLGQYSSQPILMNLINTGFSFIKNSSNELVLFKMNNYEKYDLGLNLIASGTFNGIPANPSMFQEVEFDGTNYNYFFSGQSELTILKLNLNFQTISSALIKGQTQIFGLHKSGTTFYLHGNKIENCPSILFYSNEFVFEPHSDFIVKISDQTIPQFYEYIQELSNENQTATLGHLNNLLLATETQKGLTQNHNQQQKSLVFSAKNFQLANGSNTAYSYATFSKDSLLPGPYTNPLLNNFENIDKYNRGYYVDKEMINNHLIQVSSGNSNYVIPFGIREWPAHGNLFLGQASDLASFFDANNNGIYEPEEGEYPSIYGDKCILYIYHHPDYFQNSNSSEILQYNYVFECDTNEVMKNTIFITLKNINRSNFHMNSYKIGTYLDYDIGLPFDDYIATNVDLGMIYAYNGDNFDENDAGTLGFNDTLVASGMLVLKGPKQTNDDLDNLFGPFAYESVNGTGFSDGLVDNEFFGLTSSFQFTSVIFDTLNPPFNQMLNSFQGLNFDGTPNLLGSVPINHVLFGNTDPYFYSSNGTPHTNDNYNIGAPGDKRIVGISGGNVYVDSGDTVVYTSAYISYIDSVNIGNNQAAVQKLFTMGTELKNVFNSNNSGCEMNFNFYESPYSVGLNNLDEDEPISIFPNPTSETISVNGFENTAQLTVLNLNGVQLLSKEISNGEEINLSFLPKSIYILKIETDKGLITKKIVKN